VEEKDSAAKGIMIREGELEQTRALRSAVLAWQSLEIASDHSAAAKNFLAVSGDGEVVGCASCGHEAFPKSTSTAMRFWGVAVQPSQRGHGIGQSLMQAVVARGTELGVDLIWANARESALSFYEALGFEVVGELFVDPLSGLGDRKVVLRLLP
jgi:N-acetylglutamate synthase-like GNAT family acetyltransferase